MVANRSLSVLMSLRRGPPDLDLQGVYIFAAFCCLRWGTMGTRKDSASFNSVPWRERLLAWLWYRGYDLRDAIVGNRS